MLGEGYIPPESPEVLKSLETFRDRKLGLMMHFGLYSQMGILESWPLSDADAPWARAEIERDALPGFKEAYYALNRSFNPVRFRPDDWARTIADCGFKYVVFTTKHHDGFCLYDSKFSDYKTTSPECPFSSNPNADIVRALFDACRRKGLGISAYYSKADWHHPDYWDNAGIGIQTSRNPSFDIEKDLPRWKRFQDFTRNQLLELVRNYGPLDGLWLDGCWIFGEGPKSLNLHDVIAEARKTTPGLLVVDRWQCTDCEDYITPEQYIPEEPLSVPWESCMTMSASWGYHYDDAYKSVATLIHMLVDVVTKGGNLALNIGPMPDGRLPRPAVERMRAIGAWLAKNGEAIYETRVQEPYRQGSWAFTRSKDGMRKYGILLHTEKDIGKCAVALPLHPALGNVRKVVHLATGIEMPIEITSGAARCDGNVAVVSYPEGFVRDEYADAFRIVSE